MTPRLRWPTTSASHCVVLLAVLAGSSGCATVKKFFGGSSASEAAIAEEKKAIEASKSKKDLAKLKSECVAEPKTETTKDWCSAYYDVFVAELPGLPCESSWQEYNDVKSTLGSDYELTQAMAKSLAACESWDTFFGEFLPMHSGGGNESLGEQVEAPFLAHVRDGKPLEAETASTVVAHLYDHVREEGSAGTCEDYLAVSDALSDHSEYLGILVAKECADAVPVFEAALLSEYGYVRAKACVGLGKFGEKKHIELMQNLAWTDGFEAGDYSMPVREACRDAYGKLETRLAL